MPADELLEDRRGGEGRLVSGLLKAQHDVRLHVAPRTGRGDGGAHRPTFLSHLGVSCERASREDALPRNPVRAERRKRPPSSSSHGLRAKLPRRSNVLRRGFLGTTTSGRYTISYANPS